MLSFGRLLARSRIVPCGVSTRLFSTSKAFPQDTFELDEKRVPTLDELPFSYDSQHHNLVSKNPEEYMSNVNTIKVDDMQAKEWFDELLGYIWAPPLQPHQTIASRPRMRLIDAYGCAKGRGGRKSSSAIAIIKPGSGKIFVNGIPFTEYFDQLEMRAAISEAYYLTGTVSQFDTFLTCTGGGKHGQAGAAKQAVAAALQNFDPEFRPTLKMNKLLTRDSRIVERKHTGKKKARKSFAWVKR